ncbi:MAG: dynamin family protein [Rhodomicrobium sp.]
MSSFFKFLSWKQKPAARPVSQEAKSPFALPLVPSTLLREVLGEGGGSDAVGANLPRRPGGSLLSQRLSVGTRLADASKKAIEAGSLLADLADPQTAQVIRALLGELESRVCCIAFAGQMKAGKSSLINVLVEEPGLLPADINPWTTVITRLHFGVPGKPQSGAAFTFFTRDEWRRLSLGGRTRELTERLFPEFDWSALNEQVDAMQERALRKLGTRFEDLLGTEHSFEQITPGLLNRYVGAGHPGMEDTASGSEGEFSDITRSADVFLDLGAFSFPTTVIDTPGVNDPFLVRDEITRQNLGGADICVVVLTARQPLSVSDFSLLRMLRGLKKDRLIIFVNKIDEIDGGEEVLREIFRNVAAILKREFPQADFPIVFGSAVLAQKALAGGNEEKKPVAEAEGFGEEALVWPPHDEIKEAITTDAMFQKSGLAALAVAISELMRTGPIADSLRETATLLIAVCSNMASWFETELQMLSRLSEDHESGQAGLQSLTAMTQRLAAEFDVFAEKLGSFCKNKVQELRQELKTCLDASLAETVAGHQPEDLGRQAGQIDTMLRVKLESVYETALKEAAAEISSEREKFQTELKKLFDVAGLQGKSAIFPAEPVGAIPSPSALSEPAALGVSLNGFATKQGDPAESAGLEAAIAADFEPIVERLADEAATVLRERSSRLEEQARALTLAPIGDAAGRVSQALELARGSSASGQSSSAFAQQTIQVLREKLSGLERACAAAESVLTGINNGAD